MKYNAICSDAGGILFDDTTGSGVLYNYIGSLTNRTIRQVKDDFKPWRERSQSEPGYSTRKAWQDYLAHIQLPKNVVNEFMGMYQTNWNRLPPFPGVKETLAELAKRGVPFVILTDTANTAEEMDKKFRNEFNITEGITGIVSSKDIGVTKPHKRFFDIAIDRFGLQGKDIIFLSHDYEELLGAHCYGYPVLALNYRKDDNLGFIPPERKLNKFEDILKFV